MCPLWSGQPEVHRTHRGCEGCCRERHAGAEKIHQPLVVFARGFWGLHRQDRALAKPIAVEDMDRVP